MEPVQSTPDVVTVSATASIRDAASAMRARAVGCVVVVDDHGRAVGILTDRDLALRAVAWGQPPETPAGQTMTTPVHGVDAAAGLDRILAVMRERGVRRVPVLDDGRPVGLVSLDDLLHELAGELEGLGAMTALEISEARRRERPHHRRQDAEEALTRLRHALQLGRWRAEHAFLTELDDIRERLSRALGR